ncbi:hypothetical protein SAMN04487983_10456 [Streptomyces sp. yr375]|uniref:hypothetical protein n=1 Tax=Streptomyces sp. yr375 TaxID=1761906 RepID=UPI0008CA92AE|nr:hypothetical protein [Streptomyces sp. yr375]SES35857.1 hypothetical protein SAMN04487983_10456 [Streptomyces sp. yr375]
MVTFVTVIVILAMIALGVLLIHMLNTQRGARVVAFHYGRSGTPVLGPPAPTDPHSARSRRRLHLRRASTRERRESVAP